MKDKGSFIRIHVFPSSGQDVRDGQDAGLVVLDPSCAYEKGSENRAVVVARRILESRGNSPRIFTNTLAFLAPDNTRLQDLEDGAGLYLAWQSILADRELLDLPPHQVKQAQSQSNAVDSAVGERVGEAYRWLLVPMQKTPQSDTEWRHIRLSGHDPLAMLAGEKMVRDELLVTRLAGTRLRMEDGPGTVVARGHVSIQQLVEDFARYSYMPMLADSSVLLEAIRNGLSLMMWEADSFAYADSYDSDAKRYRGLRVAHAMHWKAVMLDFWSVPKLLGGRLTQRQVRALTPARNANKSRKNKLAQPANQGEIAWLGRSGWSQEIPRICRAGQGACRACCKRDSKRGCSPPESIPGTDVKVTLHIEAEIPGGVPKDTERTVIETAAV